MIFLSPKFIEEQLILSNHHFNRYFIFEEIRKIITTMVTELLTYNLLTTKEAIKIIKICNAYPLKNFLLSEIRRYLISNE